MTTHAAVPRTSMGSVALGALACALLPSPAEAHLVAHRALARIHHGHLARAGQS